MKRLMVHVSNLSLLAWFFLDMTGLSVNGHLLVSRAYQDDGVFFLIFTAVFTAFLFNKKLGGYFLGAWLSMWFLTQFMSHWYFTIFGPSEDKIGYFSETVKLIPSTDTYIPDLYHIILHLLILFSLVSVVVYLVHLKQSGHAK